SALRSSAHTLPESGEPLDRHRHWRAQLLGEERHPQLLEQPAELVELRAHSAVAAAGAELAAKRLLERGELGGESLVALRVGAQLLQAQARRLQVARQVLQPLPRRAREPAGREQARELRADVAHRVRKASLQRREALLQPSALGLNARRRARDLLRDEREAATALVHTAREIRLGHGRRVGEERAV